MKNIAIALLFLCLSALAFATIEDASGSADSGSAGSGSAGSGSGSGSAGSGSAGSGSAGSGSGSDGSGSDGGSGSGSGSGSASDSDSGDDSKCSKYTSCNDCNAKSECGWCAGGDGTCLEGDISGPSGDEICASWSYGTCYDNSVCGSLTTMNLTCSSCQALSSGVDGSAFHCGYCKTLNGKSCVNGTIDGPLGIASNCPGSWLYDTCTDADQCADISNCSLCVANSDCGWCDGTCMSGTTHGPDSPSAQCAVWLPPGSNSSCLLPCSSYPDCETCLIEGHCGYCQVNNTHGVCQDATLNGPLNGTCAGKWVPTTTDPECPIPSDFDCSDFSQNCTQCLGGAKDNDLLCDWCETTQTCVDASSPDSECDDRKSGSCESTCTEEKDCDGCLSKTNCGWCDDQCVEGNSTQPKYASCLFYNAMTCQIPCSQQVNCPACAAADGCGYCSDPAATGCLNTTDPAAQTCKTFSDSGCPGNLGCEDADCDSCGHGDYDHCTWCQYSQYGRVYQGCYAENPSLPGSYKCGASCDDKKLSGGKVFGIVFAVIVVVFGGGFAAYVIYRKRERQRFERLL